MANRVVSLHDVHREYLLGEETTVALGGVSIDIEEGEFVAIIGPSGSGKSTLMNLIGCLDRQTSGTIEINGVDVAHLDDDELTELRASSIGFVFQQFNLLPQTTAQDNVAAPLLYRGVRRGLAGQRARILLERLGLGERLDFTTTRMSGGQQQRVAIARALVTDPKILLADEPTGALDSASGAEVMRILEEINADGRTVIMITHDHEIAARAHRRIHVLDGQVTSDERGDRLAAAQSAAEVSR